MQAALRVRVLATSSPVPCSIVRSTVRSLQQSTILRNGDESRTKSFEGYVADLLDAPLRSTSTATSASLGSAPSESKVRTEEEERLEKTRLVFGWQDGLAGPAERRREIVAKSQTIAGVTVPPRPVEPDNCCMSGCVNCVWDMYRDELEEWAEMSARARSKAAEQSGQVVAKGTTGDAVSMDDDGGGSETNWAVGSDGAEKDLFANVPVGIREFMKIEKRLKEKVKKEKGLP